MRMRRRAGFGFIELLLILATIMFLYYLMLKSNFGKPPLNKEAAQSSAQQGIVTTNYKTILDSTKAKLGDISAERSKEVKQAEGQ